MHLLYIIVQDFSYHNVKRVLQELCAD